MLITQNVSNTKGVKVGFIYTNTRKIIENILICAKRISRVRKKI